MNVRRLLLLSTLLPGIALAELKEVRQKIFGMD